MAAPVAAATGAGFPWLQAGSLLAGPLLQSIFPKAFGGQSDYKGLDVDKYKEDIVLDEGDIGGMRQGILSNIQQSIVEPGKRAIKQAGAAKGLPLGSIASATRGVTSAGAKEAAKAEPGLQRLKQQSMLDFLKLKSGADYDRNLFDFAGAQQKATMNQGALGGLSRLLMLWQGGLLDKPGAAQ